MPDGRWRADVLFLKLLTPSFLLVQCTSDLCNQINTASSSTVKPSSGCTKLTSTDSCQGGSGGDGGGSNNSDNKKKGSSGLSGGAIAAIVIVVLVVVGIAAFMIYSKSGGEGGDEYYDASKDDDEGSYLPPSAMTDGAAQNKYNEL